MKEEDNDEHNFTYRNPLWSEKLFTSERRLIAQERNAFSQDTEKSHSDLKPNFTNILNAK